jgi:hypothetical protein
MLKPSSDTSYIYILVDPRDRAVRYVGASIKPKKRLASIKSGFHCGRMVSDWARELKNVGLSPELLVVQKCHTNERRTKELSWIKYYLSAGYDLLNCDGVRRAYGMNHRWTD